MDGPRKHDPITMLTPDNQARRETAAQADLRHRVAMVLLDHADAITADTVAVFPYSGEAPLDEAYCLRVGRMLVQLIASAVRDGRVDPRSGALADLHSLVCERGLPMERLFAFAYLAERAVVDELALNDAIGAPTESWPLVSQLLRRGSFDLLGAYAERAQGDQTGAMIADRLTTLHSGPLFDLVLDKEVDRSTRIGYPLAVILFDIDHLAGINQDHGYGVGDRVIERVGILVRTYFRQHDWVARYTEDSIVVLLTGPDANHATELAEQVRHMVEERLEFTDHHTERPVRVTVSAAAVKWAPSAGVALDRERLMTDAERAVERAKRDGRNRVESVDYTSRSS